MLFMIAAKSAFSAPGAWHTPTSTPATQYRKPIVTRAMNQAIWRAHGDGSASPTGGDARGGQIGARAACRVCARGPGRTMDT